MEKSLDSHGRWRNKIVAFRVSEEEARIIDDKVALSGLTKQEYIIRRLCEKKIVLFSKSKSAGVSASSSPSLTPVQYNTSNA